MKAFSLISLILVLSLSSCGGGIRPVRYGQDQCEHCKMTVMDNKYAAAMVSAKGKPYFFDATECMLRHLKSPDAARSGREEYYVNDYSRPGSLVDARTAWYLHGDSILSPMGGNLASFSSREAAMEYRKQLGGRLLNWEELTSR